MGTNHNASLIPLGGTGSSERSITSEQGDPATFKAGLAVRLASTGVLQLADDATAVRIGISLGQDLSDAKKTAVCRVGNWVPIVLKDEGAKATGLVTISSYANLVAGTPDTLTIAGVVFTAQVGAAALGDATFQAAASNANTAASLAAQINAHEDLAGIVTATQGTGGDTDKVTIEAVAIGEDGNDVTVVYADLGTATVGITLSGLTDGKLSGGTESYGYVSEGTAVKTDDATGEASSDGDTSSAVYLSGPLIGIYPDGTQVGAAYVDMGGGL